MSYPHIYVIHLKHRADRKKQFKAAWSAAGLTNENLYWFPAVLGAALPSEKLANFHTVARTRKARAGRVGCYCSHVDALDRALRNDHFPLLLLEDDAIPTPHAPTPDLAGLFASAPADATLLYFGASPVRKRKAVKTYCQTRKGWHTPPADVGFYTTHAYGVPNAAAARELRDFLARTKMTLDSAYVRYQKANRGKVAVYCPFVFHQAEGYSNIEGAVRGER